MLELWGGIECSVVRIGDSFRDQVAETGHWDRPEDLDAVARLGIRALRFPILWETVAPDHPDLCDWSWHDARLARLHHLGIRPIAGLTHHGSGPRYTSLLDPSFPDLLARYALRVAERYPQITEFTPVNEPLTTARFSGLYGHWYPHCRDEASFLRMMINQCHATRLAMRAIRCVAPAARLIQTEDIGRTFSTPALAQQAAYENGRRWLSLDLLCGRVDQIHPWFARLLAQGIDRRELDAFLDGEACPDLIGVNHYLTSERYLDPNARAYPPHLRGGNGHRRYADVEAVRVPHLSGLTGPRARLAEVWERYGRPLAVTEVHHGCTRDEQLRWLTEVWDAASDLNEASTPVHAVTLWSLFGAMDWNSLLLRRAGHYEPGAYDVRGPKPRLTAIGRAAQELAAFGRMRHPVLASPGWWHRPDRFYAPELPEPRRAADASIVVLDQAGAYGSAIARLCETRGIAAYILDPDDIPDVLIRERPWAIIDATTLPRAAIARRYPGGSFRTEAWVGERVARLCAQARLPLLAFSSDQVFDGTAGRAALESDPVCPSGLYGESEIEREARILGADPCALIVRTSAVFGLPAGNDDEASRLLVEPGAADSRGLLGPEIVSPTFLPDLVHTALDLLIDSETGIWHLANAGEVTWVEFAQRLSAAAGLPEPPPAELREGEPRNTALASERGHLMPLLDDAIARYAVSVRRPPASAGLAAE